MLYINILVVLIVLGVKLIGTVNKVNLVLDDANKKLKTFFGDKISSTINSIITCFKHVMIDCEFSVLGLKSS